MVNFIPFQNKLNSGNLKCPIFNDFHGRLIHFPDFYLGADRSEPPVTGFGKTSRENLGLDGHMEQLATNKSSPTVLWGQNYMDSCAKA